MLIELPVLPMPWSDSIFPELTADQCGRFKGAIRRNRRECFFCGRVLSRENKTLTIDHIVPQSRGGRSTPNNIVACCANCNCHKADCDIVGWVERMEVMLSRLRTVRGLVPTSN